MSKLRPTPFNSPHLATLAASLVVRCSNASIFQNYLYLNRSDHDHCVPHIRPPGPQLAAQVAANPLHARREQQQLLHSAHTQLR